MFYAIRAICWGGVLPFLAFPVAALFENRDGFVVVAAATVAIACAIFVPMGFYFSSFFRPKPDRPEDVVPLVLRDGTLSRSGEVICQSSDVIAVRLREWPRDDPEWSDLYSVELKTSRGDLPLPGAYVGGQLEHQIAFLLARDLAFLLGCPVIDDSTK
jgi:hypothetical protein